MDITHAEPGTLVQGALADAERLDRAAAEVSIPRVEPGDSFVLHAPLEILARAGLLTLVSPDGREPVLGRIEQVARSYAEWGAPFDRRPHHSDALAADASGVLQRALRAGDSEAADDAITWLSTHLDADELVRALADSVLPSLAAAAHGSILLYLLPRVAARSLPAASMARSTIHELVRHPDWSLNWFEADRVDQHPAPGPELMRRLAAPVLAERPESTFIYPMMATAERSGLASSTLADITASIPVAEARRRLLRTAALSMLQDDPDHAPYGWSHCLTMPQAALGIAPAASDPAIAVSVAATYVLGFRAALGSVELDQGWTPERFDVDVHELIAAPPDVAAATAWHSPAEQRPDLWRALATNAGAHHDAHLAKYTLACLDATRSDPDAEQLYLAAAAFLNAWWRAADSL